MALYIMLVFFRMELIQDIVIRVAWHDVAWHGCGIHCAICPRHLA